MRQILFYVLVLLIFPSPIFGQTAPITLVDQPVDLRNRSYNWVFSDQVDQVASIRNASGDNKVLIWDFDGLVIKRVLQVDCYGITSVSFAKDGKSIFVNTDKTIEEYDLETGEKIFTYGDSGTPLGLDIQLSPNGKYLVLHYSNLNRLDIWDTQKKELSSAVALKQGSRGHTGIFSRDSQFFAIQNKDNTFRVIDLEKGTLIQEFPEVQDLSKACFSPDGKQLVISRGDLSFYDVASGALIKTYNEKALSYVQSLQFSNAGEHLLLKHRKGALLWNVKTDSLEFWLDNRFGSGAGAFFTNDDQYFAVPKTITEQNYQLAFYDLIGKTEQFSAPLDVLTNEIKQYGDRVSMVQKVWNLKAQRFTHRYLNEVREAYVNGFSDDGEHLFLGMAREDNTVFNFKSNEISNSFKSKEILTYGFYKGLPVCVTTPMIDKLRKKAYLHLFHALTGAFVKEIIPFPAGLNTRSVVVGARFVEDGKKLLFGTSQNTIHLFDLESDQLVEDMASNPSGNLKRMSLSLDESLFAAVNNQDQKLSIYNTNSLAEVHSIPLDSYLEYQPIFSNDGKQVLVSRQNHSAHSFFHLETQQETNTYRGYEPRLHPNEEVLALSEYKVIRLVDINKDEVRKAFKFEAKIWSFEFTKAGDFIIVLLENGKLIKINFNDLKVELTVPTAQAITNYRGTRPIYVAPADQFFILQNPNRSGLDLYNTETLEQMGTFYMVLDNDWLFVGQDGHFDGTETAIQRMYFANGKGIKRFAQFPRGFHQKGLMQKLLKGKQLPEVDLDEGFYGQN